MRTRRSYFLPTSTIPLRSRKQTTNVVKPEFRTIVEMADNRTMAQMLQAPIEGYEDAIVMPQINAKNFALKQTLNNLVQSNQFTGRQDPHNHLRFFNKVTSKFRRPEVPNTTITLLLFPFSLEGEARIWLDKEPSRSILTRSYFLPTSTIPRRSRKQTTNVVKPEFRTIVEMARTMAQMLQAPIEGYEDAIVVPQINAKNFALKQTLNNHVQSNQFTGRQDPHNHLRFFNKVNSTFRRPEVPNTTITLLLFPFSLEGEARIWLDKEPSRSILTWEDLVSKFINQFFPPSKTTYLRNEITNFLQKPNETFNEAWERFKDLLRQYPHRGFSELHQLDSFYNALNLNDQDALDSAAGGNFLDKIPRECLSIIERKSKVRYSRSQITDSRANTNAPLSSSLPSNSFDLQQISASLEDKLDISMNRFEKSLNEMKNSFVTSTAPIKAVEEVCVTCGANHSYNQCPLTRGNDFLVFSR
nr:reverse transcriptase domain-containing protein [Tanacetum cinerariifolium]